MVEKPELDRCAELLGALAAPERLHIVRLLRDGPCSVGNIADTLGVAPVNVSHHLMVLRHAGLVRNERQGRFILYSLSPGVLDPNDADHINLGCCRLEMSKPVHVD